jgi:hypothetical protein
MVWMLEVVAGFVRITMLGFGGLTNLMDCDESSETPLRTWWDI